MTDEQFADFNRIANEVSDRVGELIIALAELSQSDELDAATVFFAAVNGGVTGAVKVLDATGKAMAVQNLDEMFDGMMRQMADIWGQVRGQPAQQGGTIQ